MSAFPILYSGQGPEDHLRSALSSLRIVSAAMTAADNSLLTLEFTDIIGVIIDVIDKIEPVVEFLDDVDFPGYTDKFTNARRDWIVAKGVQS